MALVGGAVGGAAAVIVVIVVCIVLIVIIIKIKSRGKSAAGKTTFHVEVTDVF